MILCAAGDIHGRLDEMYAGVLAFEAALGARFDWLLHVGDFRRVARSEHDWRLLGEWPPKGRHP